MLRQNRVVSPLAQNMTGLPLILFGVCIDCRGTCKGCVRYHVSHDCSPPFKTYIARSSAYLMDIFSGQCNKSRSIKLSSTVVHVGQNLCHVP